MVIEGWPVERKKEPEFREVLVSMSHPFVPHIQKYVLEDPEPRKPLFRQWGLSTWKLLLRNQLPQFFFQYFRAAFTINQLREGTEPVKIARMLHVDRGYIMRLCSKMVDGEEAALSRRSIEGLTLRKDVSFTNSVGD